MFPILLAILALYKEGAGPSRFGKSLFMGMAWAAGAGSVVTRDVPANAIVAGVPANLIRMSGFDASAG